MKPDQNNRQENTIMDSKDRAKNNYRLLANVRASFRALMTNGLETVGIIKLKGGNRQRSSSKERISNQTAM